MIKTFINETKFWLTKNKIRIFPNYLLNFIRILLFIHKKIKF